MVLRRVETALTVSSSNGMEEDPISKSAWRTFKWGLTTEVGSNGGLLESSGLGVGMGVEGGLTVGLASSASGPIRRLGKWGSSRHCIVRKVSGSYPDMYAREPHVCLDFQGIGA